jgi:hypothetical protein
MFRTNVLPLFSGLFSKRSHPACRLILAGFLLGLLFDPEDGGSMFLPHVRTTTQKIQLFIFTAVRTSKQQDVLRRINRLPSFIRHGPHRKRRFQQFFYCCVCIRYRGNVYTEPLPSKDKGIFTEPLPSNDNGGYTDTHTHAHTNSNVIS